MCFKQSSDKDILSELRIRALKQQTQRQRLDHTATGALKINMTETSCLGESSKTFCTIWLESPMKTFINVTMIKLSYEGQFFFFLVSDPCVVNEFLGDSRKFKICFVAGYEIAECGYGGLRIFDKEQNKFHDVLSFCYEENHMAYLHNFPSNIISVSNEMVVTVCSHFPYSSSNVFMEVTLSACQGIHVDPCDHVFHFSKPLFFGGFVGFKRIPQVLLQVSPDKCFSVLIKHDLTFKNNFTCFLSFGLEHTFRKFAEVQTQVFILEEIWVTYGVQKKTWFVHKCQRYEMMYFGEILRRNIQAVQVYKKNRCCVPSDYKM